jgi:hypothetical protein
MKISVHYKENDVRISINSKIIVLPNPIRRVYEHDGRILILFPPNSSIHNVLCFNSDAELLWTIEFPDYYSYREPPGYEIVCRAGPDETGELLAYIRGRPFKLDINTGKVTFIPGFFEK